MPVGRQKCSFRLCCLCACIAAACSRASKLISPIHGDRDMQTNPSIQQPAHIQNKNPQRNESSPKSALAASVSPLGGHPVQQGVRIAALFGVSRATISAFHNIFGLRSTRGAGVALTPECKAEINAYRRGHADESTHEISRRFRGRSGLSGKCANGFASNTMRCSAPLPRLPCRFRRRIGEHHLPGSHRTRPPTMPWITKQ